MFLLDVITAAFLMMGVFFFFAGTVGLLRFPDVYTRLHAVTKADTLGLGMIVVGVALEIGCLFATAKLLLVWIVVMCGSATACHLVGQAALKMQIRPWEKAQSCGGSSTSS